MSDLISRQDVLKLVDSGYLISNGNYAKVRKMVEALPSAEPEVRTQMSSPDCISRQAAIDAVCTHGTELERRGVTVLAVANHKQATVDLLEQLPSAEPEPSELARDIATIIENEMDMRVVLKNAQPERKKGKWTSENACEFCGFQPWYERDIHTLSYCPNCGAYMREREGE